MDVLRIREDKVNSRLVKDVAVEARAKFLAEVAFELQRSRSTSQSEISKESNLSSIYLHRANLLRHEEYGTDNNQYQQY